MNYVIHGLIVCRIFMARIIALYCTWPFHETDVWFSCQRSGHITCHRKNSVTCFLNRDRHNVTEDSILKILPSVFWKLLWYNFKKSWLNFLQTDQRDTFCYLIMNNGQQNLWGEPSFGVIFRSTYFWVRIHIGTYLSPAVDTFTSINSRDTL